MHFQNKKYHIENQLLKEVWFGASERSCNKVCNLGGYINYENLPSHALLTYFVQKVFNIYRIPGFQEGYLELDKCNFRKIFKNIPKEELEKACEELKQLYKHMQECLLKDNMNSESILLYRSLREHEIDYIGKQLVAGEKDIFLISNIITSYATYGELGRYSPPILVKRRILIKDILIHNEYLDYDFNSLGKCYCSDPENEVIVINDNFQGIIKVSSDEIEWDKGMIAKYVHRKSSENYLLSCNNNEICNKSYIDFGKSNKPCDKNIMKLLIKLLNLSNH